MLSLSEILTLTKLCVQECEHVCDGIEHIFNVWSHHGGCCGSCIA